VGEWGDMGNSEEARRDAEGGVKEAGQ